MNDNLENKETTTTSHSRHFVREIRVAWAIASKDMLTYYTKPAALMFGILFPFTLFLSFSIGRDIPLAQQIPMLIAQTLFFASSSIGPVVIPMERANQTFDRFLTAPVTLLSVLMGKTLAGIIYGVGISIIPAIVGVAFFGSQIVNVGALIACFALSYCFFRFRNNVCLNSRSNARASNDASKLCSYTIALYQWSFHTDRRLANLDAGSVFAFAFDSYC